MKYIGDRKALFSGYCRYCIKKIKADQWESHYSAEYCGENTIHEKAHPECQNLFSSSEFSEEEYRNWDSGLPILKYKKGKAKKL